MIKRVILAISFIAVGGYVMARRCRPCSKKSSCTRVAQASTASSCRPCGQAQSCPIKKVVMDNTHEQKKSKPELILYVGSGCKYCAKVTNFLRQNNLSVTQKDVWSNASAKKELLALAGKGQVPCLKIDNTYMHESDDIIKKLKDILL